MEENLLDITTENLLEKFGAGNHKPGSGSAAALQGMLSAKLLVTVISLTNEEKRRKNYNSVLSKLLEMDANIQTDIFPDLTKLFQEDAIQFGKTIDTREKRDKEKDLFKRNLFARAALTELKKSIEIPFEIANHCIRLAEIADYVFDNAFQSARGDSQVALSSSIAGLAGCISIIELNFLSFESDEYEWISKKTEEVKELKSRYLHFNEIAIKKIEILEQEVQSKNNLHREVNKILNQTKSKVKLLDADIEQAAKDIQNLMWVHREVIWKKDTPQNPIGILDASKVFKKALGYEFAITNISANNSSYIGTAGLINQKDKIVLVSDNYEDTIQKFTAAHELGHAILHKQTVMHRDRPVDGANNNVRSLDELQADKFATYFLMPSNIVLQVFQQIFGISKFVINEDNTFALVQHTSISRLKAECGNIRG